MTHIPRAWLPQQMQEIAEYCGDDTVQLLIEHAGGGRLHVPTPKNLVPTHALIEWLGNERAMTLCRYYGGEYLAIPVAKEALRRQRNRQIIDERRAGASLFTLARRYGLTDRAIMNILRDSDSLTLQNDLFDN